VNEDSPADREPRGIPFRAMIPNAITALALCMGLTGVSVAITAVKADDLIGWQIALACIVGAGVLDGIDGRIARLLKAQSRFGAELDSLADSLSFGMAPALAPAFRPVQNEPETPRHGFALPTVRSHVVM